MEKVFEIVGSLIPDEQKADIKAKIDGAVSEVVKERETEVKRELSEKFGVNLFEKDIEKAFTNDKFVRKELLDKKLQEVDEFKKQFEQEKTTYEERIKALQEDAEKNIKEKAFNEVSLKLLTDGFNPERLEVIKPFINDGTTDEVVETIKSKLPELFNSNKVNHNIYPKKGNNEVKSGWNEFIEKEKQKILK